MDSIITLLTDFGTADGYVAEMKGVLYSLLEGARVVELSHDIPPQDVELARLAVARYWRRFPTGTVHLVVVDPGVGSARAALAVESDGRLLVGPDNGVLSPALLYPGSRAVSLPVSAAASPTFHGRDIFAPAAAALAGGSAIDSLGTAWGSPLVRRTREPVRLADGAVSGEVIAIDRFGNAITNILGAHGGLVDVGGRIVPVARTFSEVAPGNVLVLAGSSGLLEIAVREGSAAHDLELSRGSPVVYRRG